MNVLPVHPWSDLWSIRRRTLNARPHQTPILSWVYWARTYEPIPNDAPQVNGIEYKGQPILFGTGSADRALLETAASDHVWTYIQRHTDLIKPGQHYGAGVLGYLITLQSWTYADELYVVDDLSICAP